MSQLSQPVADVSTGGWVPTPVYAQTNDPYPGDDTYVASPPGGGTFEVRLADLGPPLTGEHVLTVRARADGCEVLWVSLVRADGVVVAARQFGLGGAFADCNVTLTAAEVDRIGPAGYAGLVVRVTAVPCDDSSSSRSGSRSAGPFSSSSGSGSSSGSASGSGRVRCPCCVGVPTAATFTASFSSAFANGSCPEGCGSIPDFTLSVSGACEWLAETLPSPCQSSGTSIGASLTCDPDTDTMNLGFGPGVTATYSMPLADFKCNGVNVLTLVSSSGECVWPASVTLTP